MTRLGGLPVRLSVPHAAESVPPDTGVRDLGQCGGNAPNLDSMADDVRLRAVAALAQAMAAAPTSRAAAAAAAEGARAALEGAFASVSRWEPSSGRLRVLVNDGELAPDEERFPVDESYPAHDFPEVTKRCRPRVGGSVAPAWVEPVAGATRPVGSVAPTSRSFQARAAEASRGAWAPRRAGRGSCVVAPLVLDGCAWGELYVARRLSARPYGSGDAEFATALAAVMAAGVTQHERLAEARRLAFTDPLTGLGNRRAVDLRLDQAMERHRRDDVVVTLVVCDINGLKRVNDTLGHAAGDQLLERFSSVLSRCGAMLPDVLAARLGGDEFCLLAVDHPADEVIRVAGELCARTADLAIGEGVACGIASTADPIGPVRTSRRLLRLADAAQYRAKARRSTKPVVAGREIVELADSGVAGPSGERRRFRRR